MSLISKTLSSARRLCKPDGRFVLILPVEPMGERLDEPVALDEHVRLVNGEWEGLLQTMVGQGWNPRTAWVERVHRSLSRLILLAECAPQD